MINALLNKAEELAAQIPREVLDSIPRSAAAKVARPLAKFGLETLVLQLEDATQQMFASIRRVRSLTQEIEMLQEGKRLEGPQGLFAIAQDVLTGSDYTLRDLRSRSRTASIIRFRFAFCREARAHGYSLNEIGDFIHRDHGTVRFALRKERP